MGEWKETLIRDAHECGMCEDFLVRLSSVETQEDAIALYKSGLDWAMRNGYPHKATLDEFFSDSEGEGIYVNRTFNGELINDFEKCIFHNCKGNIKVDLNIKKKLIPNLYFGNGCDVVVERPEPKLGAKIKVFVFDYVKNHVTLKSNEYVEFRHKKRNKV